MKIYKRTSAILLCVLMILMLLPLCAFATDSIDLNHDVKLTVFGRDEETPLAGLSLDIYLVASADEHGELTVAEGFSKFNVNIQGAADETQQTLASTLEGYVLRDQIVPIDSGKMNAEGRLSFPTAETRLKPGLYLVLGHRHTQNGYYYDISPFVVMLPYMDKESGARNYDLSVNAKFDSTPVPSEPSTVTRKVLKVWKDDGYEQQRPREVIVQLLCNGRVCDTVALNDGNNWHYSWTELDSAAQWTVVEKELEKYTVEVTREGVTFVVTNTCENSTPPEPSTPDQPSDPKLPQTGQLWWPVPMLIVAGLLFIAIGLIRRRGSSNEK